MNTMHLFLIATTQLMKILYTKCFRYFLTHKYFESQVIFKNYYLNTGLVFGQCIDKLANKLCAIKRKLINKLTRLIKLTTNLKNN